MTEESDRVNLILNNDKFIKYLKRNEKYEKKRSFCRHDLQHFLDVARIAYILNLENGQGYSRDLIYGAALLHDIGKWIQYSDGTPHNESSATLSNEILKECSFDKEEINLIYNAILNHRTESENNGSLDYLIYYSDKRSRNCFNCSVSEECNWGEGKKNKGILY